jgi:hypothetical protein
MKTLKVVTIVLVTLVLVFVGGGLVMPRGYRVERSERIQAPVEVVFSQVNDLRKWEGWSPWKAADPTMKITYSDQPVGQGGSYSWKGNGAGEGTLTILGSVDLSRIETKIDFGELGGSSGSWDFTYEDGITSVVWGFSGENPGLFGGWLTLMMDGMVGPQFEEGLRRLKKVAEATPVAPVEVVPSDVVPAEGAAPTAASGEAE